MKMKKIALAIAALGITPAAFALTPAQIDTTTMRLWLTGSSSNFNAVFKAVMTLCKGVSYRDAGGNQTNPGVIDAHMYLESTGTAPGETSGDRVAYACTVDTFDNRARSLEGKKVVVYHTVEGGSFNAYAPHLRIAGDPNPNIPATLRRIRNVESLGDSCGAGAGYAHLVNISGVKNFIKRYNSCATTPVTFTPGQALRANVFQNPDRPEGGFSDMEYLINQLNLNIATDLSSIGAEIPTNIGQGFGIAVSYPLYFQLQKNDITAGMIAATCDDAPFAATAPNLTLACQPNLPAQRYTAAAYKDGAGAIDGSLFGGAVGSKVHLARRKITSDTQMASDMRFLNKPCATGESGGALEPSRSTDSTATYVVTESWSTDFVKTELSNATNANEFGLGVVSMGNIPVGSGNKWAFVKLDRVSPNSDSFQRAEAINGSYNFWYELVAFTASTAFLEGSDLIAGINTSLGNPELTNLPGLFITAAAGVSGSNVSKGYRNGNSCQPPVDL